MLQSLITVWFPAHSDEASLCTHLVAYELIISLLKHQFGQLSGHFNRYVMQHILSFELHHEKTCLLGFLSSPTQTGCTATEDG